MELAEALAALPATYATALRLQASGLATADIARRLDVPVDAVDTLLKLAEAKLARLCGTPAQPADPVQAPGRPETSPQPAATDVEAEGTD